MRPIYLTFTPTSASSDFVTQPVVLDPYTNPQSFSVIATLLGTSSSATATIGLQVSNDDPYAPTYDPAKGNWLVSDGFFSNSGVLVATSSTTGLGSVGGSTNVVPRLIRFSATSCVDVAQVKFEVVQGGIGGV